MGLLLCVTDRLCGLSQIGVFIKNIAHGKQREKCIRQSMKPNSLPTQAVVSKHLASILFVGSLNRVKSPSHLVSADNMQWKLGHV